jgi:hypothetical protein
VLPFSPVHALAAAPSSCPNPMVGLALGWMEQVGTVTHRLRQSGMLNMHTIQWHNERTYDYTRGSPYVWWLPTYLVTCLLAGPETAAAQIHAPRPTPRQPRARDAPRYGSHVHRPVARLEAQLPQQVSQALRQQLRQVGFTEVFSAHAAARGTLQAASAAAAGEELQSCA